MLIFWLILIKVLIDWALGLCFFIHYTPLAFFYTLVFYLFSLICLILIIDLVKYLFSLSGLNSF